MNKEGEILSISMPKIGEGKTMASDSQSELEKRLEGMTPIEQLREVFSALRELEKSIEELEKRINLIEVQAK